MTNPENLEALISEARNLRELVIGVRPGRSDQPVPIMLQRLADALARQANPKAEGWPDDGAVERARQVICKEWDDIFPFGLTRLALLAAGRPPEREWRPIENAPRDGTWVLLSAWNTEPERFTRMHWAVKGQWTELWSSPRWWDGIEPSGLVPPTHWMPIPPPPDPAPSSAEEKS